MKLSRSLIETIVLTPREEGGLDALLHGDLARILALCSTGAEVVEAKPLRAISVGGPKRKDALEVCVPQGLLMIVSDSRKSPRLSPSGALMVGCGDLKPPTLGPQWSLGSGPTIA